MQEGYCGLPFHYLYRLMFAIVDIETTGGYAANNGITEVAIVLHNGKEVEGAFSSLVNPNQKIPVYITALTGITQQMVSGAPTFNELAANIHRLLNDRIFIAHNVNFDYSFLKHQMQQAGLDLDCPKLCTVRLARQVFPGLPSYSLGNLCRHFNIPILQRHRAGGDVEATVKLFEHLVVSGAQPLIDKACRRTREQSLPPHLSKEKVDNLPYCPGVYYFHNEKGKVVYVGKAKNLKYRVCSHFTHNGAGRQRQNFLRSVHNITYQTCGTELMAAILESVEIRRLWPEFNVSQKRFTQVYGLYAFEDRKGYIRLGIEKKKKNLPAIYTFGFYLEGFNQLRSVAEKFSLDLRLCFIDRTPMTADMQTELPDPQEYNQRVLSAIQYIQTQLPTFVVKDEGREPGEQSIIFVESGKFYGMGYVAGEKLPAEVSELKENLSAYPESDYIRNMVSQYVERFPAKKIPF